MTANTQISQVVEVLLTYRRQTRAELAVRLGLSGRSLQRRLNGDLGWQAEEVYAMAEHFERPIGDFFAGPDALFGVNPGDGTTRRYLARTADLVAAA